MDTVRDTLTDHSRSQTRRAEMQRSFAITGLAAGLAGAIVLACSGSPDPATAPSIPALAATAAGPTVTPQRSGTTNRLQAVDPVNRNVVWASGVGGAFVVTTDGGQHWRKGVVAGASKLEFRDVEGVSANVAYLMSSGHRLRLSDLQDHQWRTHLVAAVPEQEGECVLRLLRLLDPAAWTRVQRSGRRTFPGAPGDRRQALAGYR